MLAIKQKICLFVAQVCMLCLIHSTADAANGFVTTNEVAVDAIYKQSTFGQDFIDIRFDAALSIFNSNYLNINSQNQLNDLFNFSNQLYKLKPLSIPMFFVDNINFCVSASANIIGCSIKPFSSPPIGSFTLINSSFAATAFGGNLIAHEIGHTLGLDHIDGAGNLMNPTLYTKLATAPVTTEQVTSILNSPYIQRDANANNQRFVQISPFAIVASVPEPSTWLLLMIGVLWISYKAKRAKLPRVFDFN